MNVMNRRWRQWKFFSFFSILLLVGLACNAGQFTEDRPADGSDLSRVPPDAVELPAELDSPAAVRKAVEVALVEQFTPEASFMAVAAALERGYAYPQLEAGILARQLQPDGWIQDAAGARLAPELEPAGVLDLAEVTGSYERGGRFRLVARAAPEVDSVSLTQFLAGVQDLSAPLDPDDVTTTDGQFRFTMVVLMLSQTGYSLDQIVEAVVFGLEIAADSCAYLFTGDGTPVVPARNYNDPFDDTDCYVAESDDADDENDEAEPETAPADEAVENNDDGDVEAFCALYEQMLADVTENVDAYAAEQTVDCTDCGNRFLDAAEAAMEIAYDQMIAVAPPEIRPAVEYVAAQPLVNVLSSEEGAPPELEEQMIFIDDFATEHCAVSIQSLDEENAD